MFSQQKIKRSYAPFGSVSPRAKQKRKKMQNIDPGPGSYDVSLPIIQPIVQTIRKKNNNVIVKLGHIGTASFQGNTDRFKQLNKYSVIGPGQCNSVIMIDLQDRNVEDIERKRKLKPIRHNAANMVDSLIKENRVQTNPTIPNLKILQLQQYMQMPNQKTTNDSTLEDNKLSQSRERVKGVPWSRMKEERSIDYIRSDATELGPGQYDLCKDKSKSSAVPSSSFISESVRSYFDKIYFDTNHLIKARHRQEKRYKGDSIGPGSYDIDPKQKPSSNKYQFFGSTSERI